MLPVNGSYQYLLYLPPPPTYQAFAEMTSTIVTSANETTLTITTNNVPIEDEGKHCASTLYSWSSLTLTLYTAGHLLH